MVREAAINTIQPEDTPVHGWYRFVLSYPPHLVRKYAAAFDLGRSDLLLDPFCGTGTTLVEAKKQGIPSVGCDAHPFAAFISRVKTNWALEPAELSPLLRAIVRGAEAEMTAHDLAPLSFERGFVEEATLALNGYDFAEEEASLIPAGFLSPRPKGRLLILRAQIERATARRSEAVRDFFFLALAHVVANGAGNFAFGPEIYRTREKPDYDVSGHFARHAGEMIAQLTQVRTAGRPAGPARVLAADARTLEGIPDGISAVITSPPYPNEKDYTRTTRVETLLLRFVSDKAGLRRMKEALLRSNTRNVFVTDNDGAEVAEFAEIRSVCERIEARRIQLKKTSGFEQLYHKVVAHYFGGMRRHLRALRPKLRPGARLAYVVGDQLSFLMVPVETARLLSLVAEAEGYAVRGCDLRRERIGTKVRNSHDGAKTVRVREEVLRLERC